MESSISKSFYLLVGASVATMIGGAYLLIKNMMDDDSQIKKEIEKEIKKEITDIKKDNLSTENKQTKLTKELATKMYAEITKGFEEYSESIETEFVRYERKKAFEQSNEAWIAAVSQFLQAKHFYFEDFKKKILQKYKIKSDEFEKMATLISFYEIEQELFRIFKPKFRETNYPDKNIVKDAYIFHCQKMFDTLQNFEKVNSKFVHPEEKTFYMLMERVKIDDDLYFKFKFTFIQIKYLINFYNLYSDPEVLEWYKLIPS